MYAYDGTLQSSDVSIKYIEQNLQHDLTIVDKWCTLNKMAINLSKTVCMTIGTQRKLSKLIELYLSVQGITLQSVETHRLLGVHLDKNLTWNIHIDRDLRMYLTRFRISSYSQRIQNGRYEKNKIARNERYCMYCGSCDIEDTYHFICICPCYSTLRSRYIDNFYFLRPSVLKFNLLI